jgi:hypothetical protein
LHEKLCPRDEQAKEEYRNVPYGRAEIIYSKREGHPRSVPGGADILRCMPPSPRCAPLQAE